MTTRSIAAWAVLLATIACARELPTNGSTVAGQYLMARFDGRNLPCCSQTDSSGTVVTLAGGGMDVGWNMSAGTYSWDLVRWYNYANGTFQSVQSRFSAGTYAWNGQTLTLTDSAGQMTGTVNDGILTVRREAHQYEFGRLIQMPH